jgi:hypothetical protein
MKTYTIPIKYVFDGEFYITAQDEEEAMEIVKEHCGLVLGGKIHTTWKHDSVDWYFPTHPEKQVGKAVIA